MIPGARECSALVALIFLGCGAAADDYEPATPPPAPPAPLVEPAPLPEPYTAEASSAAPPSSAPPPTSAPPPPPPPQSNTAPPAPPPDPPQGVASSEPLVTSYPTGQWVYLSGQGWVWVPAGATATEMEGVPYTYLYTPAYGWTWYVSPWGWGPYHYGVWARHPWHPVGLHGYWVARPHAVIRLGPGRYHRR
jgi:hypothetical protein